MEAETDWAPTLCLYHGNCKDGFGAAWAIWKRWPDCQFIAVHHGQELPDVTGHHVLFVDFAPKIDWVWPNSFKSRSMVIIDHHKTSADDMRRLPPFHGGQNSLRSAFQINWTQNSPEVAVWFDMHQSGCAMAWRFAHPDEKTPSGLIRIEDRDLWQWNFPNTRDFCAAVDSYPMEFPVWDFLMDPENFYNLVDQGEILNRGHFMVVEELLANVYWDVIGEHKVPVVNAPYRYASDVGHQLLKKFPEAPFAACWSRSGDAVRWSLRSEDSRVDVSEVARGKGGGGHRNAAGFEYKAFGLAEGGS
jgi:hypothetical protein